MAILFLGAGTRTGTQSCSSGLSLLWVKFHCGQSVEHHERRKDDVLGD
jgi:hypothetical protein